jgi:hypothetical protein
VSGAVAREGSAMDMRLLRQGTAMTGKIDGELKIKAQDNPWYLLATLYGQPSSNDRELRARNRRAWNRYVSQWFDADIKMLFQGRYGHDEVRPYSADEIKVVEEAFFDRHDRCVSTAGRTLPDLKNDPIDFSNVEFDSPLQFNGFCFPKAVSFQNAICSKLADFRTSTFCGWSNFKGATFSDWTHFLRATFSHGTQFEGATFSKLASFQDATFSGGTQFEGATFSQIASFIRATFSDRASFREAIFNNLANFDGATFFGLAQFERATFRSASSFVNAELKRPTSFEAVVFSQPPRFFGAKLHEGTVWRHVEWPIPRDTTEAGEFVDAYERLKLEMDRLKKHEDELDFFALEMQSRRVLHTNWKLISQANFFGRVIRIPSLKIPKTTITPKSRKLFGLSLSLPSFTIRARTIAPYCPTFGPVIAFYGLLCDYGRSYIRPLSGLLVTVLVGAALDLPHFGLSKYPEAFGLSAANTFGVFGFRKDFIDPLVIESLSRLLKVVAAFQTVAGVVLIFLFGLAVRNRFRMK